MESDNRNMNKGLFSRHNLMMALGCIIPLLLIGILWAAGVSQNTLSFGILLLCPIMHLFMMKNMDHGARESHDRIDDNKKEGST